MSVLRFRFDMIEQNSLFYVLRVSAQTSAGGRRFSTHESTSIPRGRAISEEFSEFMSTDPVIIAERQRLAQAIQANPGDFASNIKFAQLEAKYFLADPAALPRVAKHLDLGLATLPVAHHPTVAQFVRDLHQSGVGIAAVIQQGEFPRLRALLSGQPVPQNGTAPHAVPAPQAAPQAAAQGAATSMAVGPRLVVNDIDVGHPSNTKLKEFIDGGKLEELACSYTVLDNFRMRRVIIDKIAENKSQLALACLIKIMGHTADNAIVADLVKKVVAYDPAMLQSQLHYDPNDNRLKLAVVTIMAALKTEYVVDPLTEALGDADPHVRAKAVEGLSEIIEASDDWIGHLGQTLTSDPDAGVRLACAKALQSAGSQAAFQTLEGAVKAGISDEPIKKILTNWGSKSQSQVSSAALDKRKAKMMEDKKKDKGKGKPTKSGGSKIDPKLVMMIGVFIGALILIGIGILALVKSMQPEPLGTVIIPPTVEQVANKRQQAIDAKNAMLKALGMPPLTPEEEEKIRNAGK